MFVTRHAFPTSLWSTRLSLLLAIVLPEGASACDIRTLYTWLPPRLEEFAQCVVDRRQQDNMTHVGADISIKAECWCQTQMAQLIERWNCTEHEDWKHLYMVDCNADCSSPAANQCLQDCPALCLEDDYAPEDCQCDSCYQYMYCIAEHGKRRSQSGDLGPICDDMMFDASSSVNAYLECTQEHPMRTSWHRQNAVHHCICDSNVKRAAEEHNCCGATWAHGICHEECKSEADCNSEAGMRCRQHCRDTCRMIHPDNRTDACTQSCFDEGGDCAQYKTCEPLEPPEFEYICDDGSRPNAQGCCITEREVDVYIVQYAGCPTACEQKRSYWLPHGLECQCFRCPTTEAELDETWRNEILPHYVEAGQESLHDMAVQVGLTLGPTAEMQEMMRQRNEEIDNAVQAHEGPYNAVLEAALQRIVVGYNQRIMAAARLAKHCEDQPDSERCTTPTPAPTPVLQTGQQTAATEADDDDDAKEEGGFKIALIVIIIVVVVVLCCCAAGAYVFLSNRASKRQAASGDAAAGGGAVTMEPIGNDPNVVVGRPCEGGGEGQGDNAQPVAGAPVQPAQKGGGQPSDSKV